MKPIKSISPCHLAGGAFLVLQLALILYARFIPERFFCWGPYDEHSFYEVGVTVGGVPLAPGEIADRYRYPARGWEPRSVYNVISQIRQYETTYGRDEAAEVVLDYSINGHEPEVWRWPEN